MSTALTGIFSNGVAGMLAFTQAMGTISDNIANQNTVGYKRVDTLFSTLVGRTERSVRADDSAAATLIARNTAGVRPTTRQVVDIQGAIQPTNRQYDLAINGGGMFVFGDSATGTNTDFFFGRGGDFDELIPVDTSTSPVVADTRAFLANKNGQFLLAQQITAADLLTPTAPATLTELVAVQTSDQATFNGQPTTTAELSAVIPASGTTTVGTPIFFIDSDGVRQGITLTFSNPFVVPGATTRWDVSATDSNGVSMTVTAPAIVTFDSSGDLAAGTTVDITDNHPSQPTTFSLDLGNVAMLGEANSTGGNQAIQISYEQDGLPAGAFEGLTIREDGVIFGRYTGGATQPLYRIPLAAFANPNALEARAGNVYQITTESGDPEFRLLGVDDFATLVLSAVETANVDLADQFSQMIITQRAYSSAAQIFQTADEMSATIRDLT